MPRIKLFFLVTGICMIACSKETRTSESSVDNAQTLASLIATDSALTHAIAARDLDRTIAFYAADASLLPVAEPIIVGRDGIRAEYQKLFAIPRFSSSAHLVHADVALSGDLGYTRGTYEARLTAPDDTEVTEKGKFVSIWRRQTDGTWRIVVDTYNTDAPPPAHK